MKSKRLLMVLIVICLFAIGTMAAPALAKEFYEGKTIRCIVPYAPGGGTDTFFRTFVEFWQRHVPGKPKMIIQNMPGAGGVTAHNYVYEVAKPDGMTVLTCPWLSIAQVTGQPGVRYNFAKMGFVGGDQPVVTDWVRQDAKKGGFNSPTDIMNADKIIVGGLRASTSLDLRLRMGLDLLGVKYKYVTGFQSGAKIRAAQLRGEITYFGGNVFTYISNYKDEFEKDNSGYWLWYHPTTFDAQGNSLPVAVTEGYGLMPIDKVYEKIHGKKPSGQMWEAYQWFQSLTCGISLSGWLPPDSPKEALDALRVGWNTTTTDPDFIAASIKRFGGQKFFATTEAGQAIVDSYINNSDPKMIEWFKDYIKKGEEM